MIAFLSYGLKTVDNFTRFLLYYGVDITKDSSCEKSLNRATEDVNKHVASSLW